MAFSIPKLQTFMAAGELDLAPGVNNLTWDLPEAPDKWGYTFRGTPTNIAQASAPTKAGISINNTGAKVRIFLWAWCTPRSER